MSFRRYLGRPFTPIDNEMRETETRRSIRCLQLNLRKAKRQLRQIYLELIVGSGNSSVSRLRRINEMSMVLESTTSIQNHRLFNHIDAEVTTTSSTETEVKNEE